MRLFFVSLCFAGLYYPFGHNLQHLGSHSFVDKHILARGARHTVLHQMVKARHKAQVGTVAGGG